MKVIVCVVNSPQFIKFQYKLLKKFMPVEYEFIVFNDAKSFSDYTNFNNPNLRNEIVELCNNLGIKCINIDNDHHQYTNVNASTRHTDSLRIMREYMDKNPDKYLMIDSDMFPISTIDIDKYSQYECGAIVHQQRGNIEYMWPNLFFFDITKLPDWNLINWDIMPGCDTGAMTNQWFHKQKELKNNSIYFIKHLGSGAWNNDSIPDNVRSNELIEFLNTDSRNINGMFWCEIFDKTFLHYRAGSNWNGEGIDIHKNIINNLEKYLDSIV